MTEPKFITLPYITSCMILSSHLIGFFQSSNRSSFYELCILKAILSVEIPKFLGFYGYTNNSIIPTVYFSHCCIIEFYYVTSVITLWSAAADLLLRLQCTECSLILTCSTCLSYIARTPNSVLTYATFQIDKTSFILLNIFRRFISIIYQRRVLLFLPNALPDRCVTPFINRKVSVVYYITRLFFFFY